MQMIGGRRRFEKYTNFSQRRWQLSVQGASKSSFYSILGKLFYEKKKKNWNGLLEENLSAVGVKSARRKKSEFILSPLHRHRQCDPGQF